MEKDKLGIEYYFYKQNTTWAYDKDFNYIWKILKDIFNKIYDVNIKDELNLRFDPGMISIDIPLEKKSRID